jgi:hypothetical protein
MKLHERTFPVKHARDELDEAISKLADKYNLTYGELTSIIGGYLTSMAMYQIREERHGDVSKKGDEA